MDARKASFIKVLESVACKLSDIMIDIEDQEADCKELLSEDAEASILYMLNSLETAGGCILEIEDALKEPATGAEPQEVE